MISDNSLFSSKVKDILTQQNWTRFSSPNELLRGWEGIIAECKKGYSYNIYEYDNDISIRKFIELLLSSEILREYEEFDEFSEAVKYLDTEFSEFLQKDTKRSGMMYWWEQGVPKYAGEELAKDFFNNYKIKVETV